MPSRLIAGASRKLKPEKSISDERVRPLGRAPRRPAAGARRAAAAAWRIASVRPVTDNLAVVVDQAAAGRGELRPAEAGDAERRDRARAARASARRRRDRRTPRRTTAGGARSRRRAFEQRGIDRRVDLDVGRRAARPTACRPSRVALKRRSGRRRPGDSRRTAPRRAAVPARRRRTSAWRSGRWRDRCSSTIGSRSGADSSSACVSVPVLVLDVGQQARRQRRRSSAASSSAIDVAPQARARVADHRLARRRARRADPAPTPALPSYTCVMPSASRSRT